jgi:S1-C subfamily serine protease
MGYGGLGYGLGYGGMGYGGMGYGGMGYGGMGYGGIGYGGYGMGMAGNGFEGFGNGLGYGSPINSVAGLPVASQAVAAPANLPAATLAGNLTVSLPPGQRPILGITEQPVINSTGKRAMRVESVAPGTPAEKAGLKAGDVIESVNGYVTEAPGNLAWIISHAAPDNVLKLRIRGASDGKVHMVAANLRPENVSVAAETGEKPR